jgi:hypothetical protein
MNSLLLIFSVHEFYLPTDVSKLIPGVCTLFPSLCDFDMELVMGPTTFLNESRISYYARYEPNPTSVKSKRTQASVINFRYGSLGSTSE